MKLIDIYNSIILDNNPTKNSFKKMKKTTEVKIRKLIEKILKEEPNFFDQIEKNKVLETNPITLKIINAIKKYSKTDFDEKYEEQRSWNPDTDDDMIFRFTVSEVLSEILRNEGIKTKINLDSTLGNLIMKKFEEQFG